MLLRKCANEERLRHGPLHTRQIAKQVSQVGPTQFNAYVPTNGDVVDRLR